MTEERLSPGLIERPLVGAGISLVVSVEPAWLEPDKRLFLGITSPVLQKVEGRDLDSFVRRNLISKVVGSAEECAIIDGDCLRFSVCSRPPDLLPVRAGRVYVELKRRPGAATWELVVPTLQIAVCPGSQHVVGSMQGERQIQVRLRGESTTLQFDLYVLFASSADRGDTGADRT